ncbi:hypothetical protein F8B43_2543 [Methylorubrum populi]|uniref:Uncharacterized protein n=1 Tax=Methylorubrum populi TaxID=223967 RepID=A0A833J4K0_9HYPH|nr:hypothetical protein F8B43_2543 [Methylorubrum populi]
MIVRRSRRVPMRLPYPIECARGFSTSRVIRGRNGSGMPESGNLARGWRPARSIRRGRFGSNHGGAAKLM